MAKTYEELKMQYEALRKTYDYMLSRKDEVVDFFKRHNPRSLTFIGCGSGYCVCQSGEISAKVRLGIPAATFAAGDLMLNWEKYGKMLEGTMFVAPSRSGSTSEVINAINNARKLGDIPVLAITCVEGSELSKLAGLSLEIPWAFDASVCQTRTVTNLYTAQLMVIAFLGGDEALLADIKKAIEIGDAYMEKYEESLKKIAFEDWNYAVILADGEMQGIAAEGAIAFTEIPQLVAHYYHVLDVRHGPMVMVKDGVLVIACLSESGYDYQKKLIEEIAGRGAKVVTYSDSITEPIDGVSLHVTSGTPLDNAARGIPFIMIPQMLAYYKAECRGINPDNPDGITAWVKL